MRPCALVTGASTGIGYELALLLARDGHRLVLVSRDRERLESAAARLRAEVPGVAIETHPVDLADPDGLEEVCARAAHLAPDVLVNNAGFGGYGPFARTSPAEEAAMIATNVTALTMLAKAVLPGMLERSTGRILNVGSTASFAPGPFAAVYAATKAYVLSFSEALAEETRGSGVTVTALCPGPTHTRFAARASMGGTRVFRGPVAQAGEVARIGYDALQAGRSVVVVGRVNRLMLFAIRFTPRRIVALISRRELSEVAPA
ncbi:SDR family NAD(P)-dependent oxidoreductase [Azorhizobium doebereinerae]|uniref:SDR family NAD(P)-dependent oxidoreductase n=1 Tax=Azorhizobium doebereinerae TaxID=281091 RepID=UPI0004167C85|nr:SDR family oxidoreductase [Azorhizobium doebereinerae]